MRRVGIWVVSIVALLAIIVGVYELRYTHRYRYRLTIEVGVDGQVKSGSSVIQVTHRLDAVPGRPPKYTASVSGAAVFIDLGPRGNLFALLTGPDNTDAAAIAAKTFSPPPFRPDLASKEQQLQELTHSLAKAELHPDELPLLVMFKNMNDPSSIVQARSDDLSGTFGPGVRLLHATIEMTNDPVTTGINEKLPWLVPLAKRGGTLDGSQFMTSNELKNTLGAAAFRRGS
jgi:hypothetical protein